MKVNLINTFISSLFMLLSASDLLADDCKFLRYVTYCEVKNNKVFTTDTVIIEVYNREGEAYTNVVIPYSKNEKISGLDAWIEDASGNRLQSLKKSDIIDRSAISDFSLYQDDFIKTFKLKYNVYPYKVCYTYTVAADKFISIIHWSPVNIYNISTSDARLVVSLPLNYKVNCYNRDIPQIKTDTVNNVINYSYKSSYKGIDHLELFAPPFADIIPLIVIVPKQFTYGVEGGSDNWREYGRWYFNLNKGLDELPESEKVTVNKLLEGITDKIEKIKILYHYMQDNTRYINVSIGIGGHKAYPASYVAQNKYGDCKALTNYMKALLKYAGINSYFVLINLDLQPQKLIEEIPCEQFNHIILQVPLEKDTIWLENTSNTEPFRYISSYIQNRRALLIDENNSRIISMPSMKQDDNGIKRKISIDINFLGDAEAKLTISFKGEAFESFNALHAEFNKNEQDRIINQIMPFASCDVMKWDLKKINRDTAEIELAVKLNLHNLVRQMGNESYLSILPVVMDKFSNPKDRKFPLQLPFPACNIDSIIYIIPLGTAVKSLPQAAKISGKYGCFEFKAEAKDNLVIVTKRLELFRGTYSKEEYTGFYEFISAVKKFEKQPILLSK